jgi:hypothetical protein
MDSPLSVLLRDGTHTGATVRLALKAEQFAIQTTRTPIQVPLPSHSPILLDFGFNRPALTISGLIDNIGQDNSNSTSGFENMESISLTDSSGNARTYYIPYKNYFEKFLTESTKWTQGFECEFGDASTPISTSSVASTGGGIYECVVGQFQFTIAPGTEDRWVYSISLPAKIRQDITFD